MTSLEILHWNDIHGRFDALSRLSARARSVRAEAAHPVLLLDGGDVEDTSVRLSALSYGVAGWRLLGAAGVDAGVVGNGGLLRYGPTVLTRYADALGSAPLLCDIEDAAGEIPAGAAASRMVEAAGLRVGLVGITDFYHQYDVFGLRERGRVTAVRDEARSLRADGADLVVVLSHAGIHHDRGLSWSLRGLVDLIVGGHTHDLLHEGDLGQGVPIAQAGCYGEHLGRILLDVHDGRVDVRRIWVEEVTEDSPTDAAVDAELAKAEIDLDAWLDEPVGRLDEPAPHRLDGRSAAAELVIAALLHHFPADLGVLIAAHCGGGLPAGTLSRRDLWETTSSPGNPATATMTGAEVRAMLARGLSDDFAARAPRTFRSRPFGRLQVVGATVSESDAPEVTVAGDPLDDNRIYTVTGSDLELASYGGLLAHEPADVRLDATVILPEVLEAYLVSQVSPGA
ncbi:MAG: 5'-nucleotidase C-terminal domain-containing protein [Nocardioides sp.]